MLSKGSSGHFNPLKRKAIFLLYRVAGLLGSPAVLLYLLARALGDRRYFSTLRERFGELSALWQKTAPEAIWLHAVSVGEVLAAVPLIEELARRVEHVELETVPDFFEIFVEACQFKPMPGGSRN